jgi:hypothetical protein
MKTIQNQCGECSCEVTTYENGMRQISKIKWDCIDPTCPYLGKCE